MGWVQAIDRRPVHANRYKVQYQVNGDVVERRFDGANWINAIGGIANFGRRVDGEFPKGTVDQHQWWEEE